MSDQIDQLDELIHADGDGTAFFEKTFITPSATVQLSGLALFAAIAAALKGAFWAYDGWKKLTYIAGDVKQSQSNIPLTLLRGMLTVTTIYVLMNMAYLYVLPVEELAKSTRFFDFDVAEKNIFRRRILGRGTGDGFNLRHDGRHHHSYGAGLFLDVAPQCLPAFHRQRASTLSHARRIACGAKLLERRAALQRHVRNADLRDVDFPRDGSIGRVRDEMEDAGRPARLQSARLSHRAVDIQPLRAHVPELHGL